MVRVINARIVRGIPSPNRPGKLRKLNRLCLRQAFPLVNGLGVKVSNQWKVIYMKAVRYMFILTALALAVLASGCATSQANASKSHPLAVADVEALVKAGMSDDVIISQIKSSGTAYRLSTADIIGLHNAGVSNAVIQYMINTAPPAPANAVVAPAAVAPPYYYYPYYYPYPWYWWPPVSFAFRFR